MRLLEASEVSTLSRLGVEILSSPLRGQAYREREGVPPACLACITLNRSGSRVPGKNRMEPDTSASAGRGGDPLTGTGASPAVHVSFSSHGEREGEAHPASAGRGGDPLTGTGASPTNCTMGESMIMVNA
jgi:hypothetical protein